MIDRHGEIPKKPVQEPYRTKVVESIRLPSRAEREQLLRDVGYNPFYLKSQDVYIDLLTDSGTGAMSDTQWAALMVGDETYAGSRSYDDFEQTVRDITGYDHIVPVHQGRAGEHLVMQSIARPGGIVLSNTLFDTTRAHVEYRDALPVDLLADIAWDFDEPHPFKGNFDLDKLRAALEHHHGRVSAVVATLVNNLACSSPVSLENMRGVRELADRFGVPVFIDASRFAENAWLVTQREDGQRGRPVADVARDFFALADGCWMSAKKDGLVNIGGFIAVRDDQLADECRQRLVLFEGFPSYGGLAGRDLQALSIGLREALNEDYLRHRVAQIEYLHDGMREIGVPVSTPAGGSGVYVDVARLYPHLNPDDNPGITLIADLYLHGGVRMSAGVFHLTTVDPTSGSLVSRDFSCARLALPRRVYGKAHLDHVIEAMGDVVDGAHESPAYKLVKAPRVLTHFFARFEPVAT
ncbi:tryptophanase [Acrocarpospora catenulata]|uniref:tryptophanase n=1 Tax=Acrocarpospora catenulata TaxID=2836182 RepID=UPI001BDB3A29|nr:tryptophanase [Acrocarpospora catenulata]